MRRSAEMSQWVAISGSGSRVAGWAWTRPAKVFQMISPPVPSEHVLGSSHSGSTELLIHNSFGPCRGLVVPRYPVGAGRQPKASTTARPTSAASSILLRRERLATTMTGKITPPPGETQIHAGNGDCPRARARGLYAGRKRGLSPFGAWIATDSPAAVHSEAPVSNLLHDQLPQPGDGLLVGRLGAEVGVFVFGGEGHRGVSGTGKSNRSVLEVTCRLHATQANLRHQLAAAASRPRLEPWSGQG